MRRLIFLAPIGVFALVIVAFGLGLRRDPAILPSTLLNKPLPVFSLPALNAGETGLGSAQMTGEPRLLNVFGSWCVACRFEHPFLMTLKARGVPIEGLDWRDTPEAAQKLLASEGNPYQWVGFDPLGHTAIDLGVTGAPETFIVDRAGIVRYKQVGPITPEVWADTLEPLMTRLKSE